MSIPGSILASGAVYFFDSGVFQAIRPRGPQDSPEEILGPAAETLLLHHLRALNDYLNLGYTIYYWRTRAGDEVDFVLYGERGLRAFEVKTSHVVRSEDSRSLRRFLSDYPQTKAYLIYTGHQRYYENEVEIAPFVHCIRELEHLL
jgi:predicted AAA+ superfamily ATPase